jgi:eukaryotic-like serine/threonine-protein kinase
VIRELKPDDPRLIGPYRLTGVLGSGGMGRVYLGLSPGGRSVAVKVIRVELAADPNFRVRFRREVAAARRVSGLFTAVVVDADLDAAQPWLATAYVPGPSLGEAVRQHGPLPTSSALTMAAGLAEGLAAIHAAGVAHRDLKPSNVLLAEDGPRVIDFGISRAPELTSVTTAGAVFGSPGFMSPEQAEGGQAGQPSDIFSLGAVLVYAVTGQSPFGNGSTPALLYRVVHGMASLDGVPDQVRALAVPCLAKDPDQRPTAAQLLSMMGTVQPMSGWLPTLILDRRGQVPDSIPPDEPAPDEPPTADVAPAAFAPEPGSVTPAPLSVLFEPERVAPEPVNVAAGALYIPPPPPEVAVQLTGPTAESMDITPVTHEVIEAEPATAVPWEPAAPDPCDAQYERRTETMAPPPGPPAQAADLIPGLRSGKQGEVPGLPATYVRGLPGTGPQPAGAPPAGAPPAGGSLPPAGPAAGRGRSRRPIVVATAAALAVVVGLATWLATDNGTVRASGPLTRHSTSTSPSQSPSPTPAQSPSTTASSAAQTVSHQPSKHPSKQTTTPASVPTPAHTTAAPVQTHTSSPPKPRATHSATTSFGISVSGASRISCADIGSVRSSDVSSAQLVVNDNSSVTVQVESVGTDGSVSGYATVEPGGQLTISTSTGDYWVIASAGGSCLTLLDITGNSQVNIT